jgi:SAM-dependent methyltransferase
MAKPTSKPTAPNPMQLWDPRGAPTRPHGEVIEELLSFDDAQVLELGCGRGETARAIATRHRRATVLALEVDTVQLEANRAGSQLANLTFAAGGAERIPAGDDTFDIVMMVKSFHHVPVDDMLQALREVRRVLQPGGLAYIAEPPFAGAFNEVMRIFHDEREVRAAAFAALKDIVSTGAMALETERFFLMPLHFDDFEDFAARHIDVTHTEHRLSTAQKQQVRAAFDKHMTPEGADFLVPMRIDLLRKLG